MRMILCWLWALTVALLGAPPLWAQAGRYVPLLRPSGGGGSHFVPHLPWHGGGGSDDSGVVVVWVIGLIVLVVIGWYLVQALGRQFGRRPGAGPETGSDRPGDSQAGGESPAPDQVLSPAEVAGKAGQTTRLLEFLARQDPDLDPAVLSERFTRTFRLVQGCWAEQDYGPVRDLLMPGLLAEHEGLLRSMRWHGEVNRIEGLRVERLEFVHLSCPLPRNQQQVTALVTFEACVYFVDARTLAYRRGPREPRRFQECWTFRRQGDSWRLQTITRNQALYRLRAANEVEGLTERQLQEVQQAVPL
jgi:predicted lipid-binding transport protein (Tim44 family)